MAEKTFFKTVIIVLVLINISTLAYVWLANKPPRDDRNGNENVVNFLTRELNLDDAKKNKLAALHDDYQHKMRGVHEHLRNLHSPFFNLLRIPLADTLQVSTVIDSMAVYHKQMEWLTFQQFKDIRNICTPAQQQKFDDIVDETMRLLAPGPPGKNN